MQQVLARSSLQHPGLCRVTPTKLPRHTCRAPLHPVANVRVRTAAQSPEHNIEKGKDEDDDEVLETAPLTKEDRYEDDVVTLKKAGFEEEQARGLVRWVRREEVLAKQSSVLKKRDQVSVLKTIIEDNNKKIAAVNNKLQLGLVILSLVGIYLTVALGSKDGSVLRMVLGLLKTYVEWSP